MNNIINFQKSDGLIPVVIQEETTGDILMLGYMNKEAWEKTKETGWVYYWSRERKKLWLKGEESGNKLLVKKIYLDCDGDALLICVRLIGSKACHKGYKTCFIKEIK